MKINTLVLILLLFCCILTVQNYRLSNKISKLESVLIYSVHMIEEERKLNNEQLKFETQIAHKIMIIEQFLINVFINKKQQQPSEKSEDNEERVHNIHETELQFLQASETIATDPRLRV